MTTNPQMPVPLSKEELIQILTEMLQGVRFDDSFGGYIEYDALDGPPCPDGPADETHDRNCLTCCGTGQGRLPEGKDFMVRAGYRLGNSQGQGGMRFVSGED